MSLIQGQKEDQGKVVPERIIDKKPKRSRSKSSRPNRFNVKVKSNTGVKRFIDKGFR